KEFDDGSRTELTDQIDDIGFFEKADCSGKLFRLYLGKQVLKRSNIANYQIAHESELATIRSRAEFAFQGLDARLETGSGGGKPPLKHLLQTLEPVVAQRLGEAHQARRVNTTALANGIH